MRLLPPIVKSMTTTAIDQDDPVARNRRQIALRVKQGGLSAWLYAVAQMAKAAAMAWLDRRAASKGAALTLYVLFSLAPMLMLVVALASLFFDEDVVRTALLTCTRR